MRDTAAMDVSRFTGRNLYKLVPLLVETVAQEVMYIFDVTQRYTPWRVSRNELLQPTVRMAKGTGCMDEAVPM